MIAKGDFAEALGTAHRSRAVMPAVAVAVGRECSRPRIGAADGNCANAQMRRNSSALPPRQRSAFVLEDGGAMTSARFRQRVRQRVESFVVEI